MLSTVHIQQKPQYLRNTYHQTKQIQNQVKTTNKTLLMNKSNEANNMNKQPMDSQVCSKYNACMEAGATHSNKLEHDISADSSFFEVPSQILKDQVPQEIEAKPFNLYIRDTHEIDLIVLNNLAEKKRIEAQQKKVSQKHQKSIQKELQKLKSISKQQLKKAIKKSLSVEKRNAWGHSIYGQEKQLNAQNEKEKIKQQKSKEKKEPKIKMKPINQRIKEYQQKQKCKMSEANAKFRLCGHDQNVQNSQEERKRKIEENATKILQNMRNQKKQAEQKKRVIQGKIRAIEIQSIKSLKNFKKKPVDPTIEFKVDFIPEISNKKIEKQKNKEQLNQEEAKKRAIAENLKKLANFNQKRKPAKTPKNSSTVRKQFQTISEPQSLPQNTFQASQNQSTGKFYIWNIPIYHDDYKTIQTGSYEYKPSIEANKNGKTFRSEVNEYLQNKLHAKMQKYNKASKQILFQQLVEKKKKQYLEEFENEERGFRNVDEVFWNEDELFKMAPLSNF